MKVSRICAVFIGLVLTFAGAAKALSIDAFTNQIISYNLVTDRFLVNVGAWSLCTIECILGVALIVNFRPRLTIIASISLFLCFLSFAMWLWLFGGNQNCGCFGAVYERTASETIFENLFMIAILYVAWRSSLKLQTLGG